MAQTVTLPALGESVTEGTLTTWLKNVGDSVKEGEAILEVATDKVDSEVPSPFTGVLTEILAQVGTQVEVGSPLCVIDEGGAPAAAPTPVVEEKPAVESSALAEPQTVTLPALGESVTEGTLTTWLKNVGDSVKEGEAILEVATDKVDSEVPSPFTGVLTEILAQVGTQVEVGSPLCIISGGTAPAASAPASAASDDPAVTASSSAPAASAAQPASANAATQAGVTYATPIVRKLAKELGVDIESVQGTGVAGRITKADVTAAAATSKPAPTQPAPTPAAPAAPAAKAPSAAGPVPGTTEKMSRMRQVIADRMMTSLNSTAQLTTVIEVDVTKIAMLRAKAKDQFLKREGTKLTYLPFFVKAATEALKVHPKINSRIDGDEVTYYNVQHIGIAVDTPRGLLVPVVRNAGDLTIAGLARAINDVADRTRNNTITGGELQGSTFTITNTGSGGALFDTPVLNYPEEAILGLGAIVKRPMVIKDSEGNDSIAIRHMVYLAISYDHRLIDGADASRYLMTVKKRLEEADFAAELGL